MLSSSRRAAVAACAGGALSATLLIAVRLLQRRYGYKVYGSRWPHMSCWIMRSENVLHSSAHTIDEVLDSCSSNFASRACTLLRSQGFVRLRLAPADVPLAGKLFSAADAFFEDADATRLARVPPKERQAVDSRCGYVGELGREFFELHPRTDGDQISSSKRTVELLRTLEAFAAASHAVCEDVVQELARRCKPLESLLLAEREEISHHGGSSVKSPCLTAGATVECSSEGLFSASMIRVHRRQP